jgi:N6-adenosine-specific RNA methylase IME4
MQEHITQGGTPESHETTLAQINCTKSEHQRLKMLASIPQDRIDEYFRQANEVVREASRSGVLHLYSVPPQPSPPLPAGKFRVILSDNPWEYEHTPGRINPPEAHYPTMSTEEMCAMGDKISALAAKDCTLFMWVPPCKLPEGLKVLAAWGFEWVTQKVWDKGGRNMGPYGNVVHENLLIGKRGSGTPTTTNKKLIQSFDSIQRCPKTRTHSQKPVTYHEMIEKLWPGQKYIELFAREPEHRRKGWKYWGNELEDLLSGSSPGGTRTRNNQPLHVVRPAKVVPFRNDLARTKAASG